MHVADDNGNVYALRNTHTLIFSFFIISVWFINQSYSQDKSEKKQRKKV